MFNNVSEMIQYINNLKNIVENKIEEKKAELNNFCECCKIKPIEIIYKANNFTEEYMEDEKICYKINAHLFCADCYKHIIDTGQLVKSEFMAEIDKKYFPQMDPLQ